MTDPKAVLHGYLQSVREALLWKVDGLSERELRMPRTPTGTNLIGIIKHCANVEIGYFGDTFGRGWPGQRVPPDIFDTDPQADWYLTEDESADAMVASYRDVWAFADETIESRPLDAPGRVPWWPEERADVTLHQVMVHVIVDLARHAGHADILREEVDGAAGMARANDNLPDTDWSAYVARLNQLAERFD